MRIAVTLDLIPISSKPACMIQCNSRWLFLAAVAMARLPGMKSLSASLEQTSAQPRSVGQTPPDLLLSGMACRILGRAHGRCRLPEAPALEGRALLSGAQPTSGTAKSTLYLKHLKFEGPLGLSHFGPALFHGEIGLSAPLRASARDKGIRVMLGGEGGDFWFTGELPAVPIARRLERALRECASARSLGPVCARLRSRKDRASAVPPWVRPEFAVRAPLAE